MPKGTGGTPAHHVVGGKSGFISASETLEAATRFESEHGIVEIDVAKAEEFGATTVEQPDITGSIRTHLKGAERARALRDTARAEELLFEGHIPIEAILGFK